MIGSGSKFYKVLSTFVVCAEFGSACASTWAKYEDLNRLPVMQLGSSKAWNKDAPRAVPEYQFNQPKHAQKIQMISQLTMKTSLCDLCLQECRDASHLNFPTVFGSEEIG